VPLAYASSYVSSFTTDFGVSSDELCRDIGLVMSMQVSQGYPRTRH